MRSVRIITKHLQNRNRLHFHAIYLSSSQFHPHTQQSSFGIAFDIDGVVLRGNIPIGNSPRALSKLYDDSGSLRIPYVFLTNGGGIPDSKRALELHGLLGANILPSQVIQGHSAFKQLAGRFMNDFVIAIGKGDPAAVMTDYGFRNVLSIDEYASCFDHIDPLATYKKWRTSLAIHQKNLLSMVSKGDVCAQRVEAVFVLSDSVDWSRDIQVLCDVLRTGGLPGREHGDGDQPPLYFAHDDLLYQATFPIERLGLGAFRIALESIYNSIQPVALKYTAFGKPSSLVFKNAETVLRQLVASIYHGASDHVNAESHQFNTLYMVGDNPSVDVKGAHQAGDPWFSILTRTGVFRGKDNYAELPADLVVDTVEEAVDFILKRENVSSKI